MRGEEESGHRHLFGELRESRPTKFQPSSNQPAEQWNLDMHKYHIISKLKFLARLL